MMYEFITNPLPVTPRPCGEQSDDMLVASWRAAGAACPGEAGGAGAAGVVVLERPREAFSAWSYTFEAWIRWPQQLGPGMLPATLAQAKGGEWSWWLGFDHAGSLRFSWRSGEFEKGVYGELMLDTLTSGGASGGWRHVAVVFFDKCYTNEPYSKSYSLCALFCTEPGRALPRCVGRLEGFETPAPAKWEPTALSVGRSPTDERPGPIYIGSAAFHRCVRTPGDFPALGHPALPAGVTMNGQIESGSLGSAFALSADTIFFTSQALAPTHNYWFAFRIRGAEGRTLTFHHAPASSMAVVAFISEDGGETWVRPNGGLHRRSGAGYQGQLTFTHTFESDEAIVAASPMVTTSMAAKWVDTMASGHGARVHEICVSPKGHALRAVEIGNADEPLVYMQAGQHSMMERIGFYMMAEAFEAAAADTELLKRSRWMVLPVVNVDSYAVLAEEADTNMNRLWGVRADHPIVSPIARFIEREVKRTGAAALLDFHAGGAWRGHTVLSEPPQPPEAFIALERLMKEEGLNYTIRHGVPPAEAPGAAGVFGAWGLTLPGVGVCLTVELSAIAVVTPEGSRPVSLENLRDDGRRWYKALRGLVAGPGT